MKYTEAQKKHLGLLNLVGFSRHQMKSPELFTCQYLTVKVFISNRKVPKFPIATKEVWLILESKLNNPDFETIEFEQFKKRTYGKAV